jgi:uncharacterized protein with putative carbohydrate binding module
MLPKKLTQFVASVAETTVYTVPANTYTMLKQIVVANTSSTAQVLYMSLVPLGNTASFANRILPGTSVNPNTVTILDFSTVMASGDFLTAVASANGTLTITVTGLEDPGSGTSSGTGNFASTGMVVTSTTRPATPYEGQIIYETDTDKMLFYNGGSWVGERQLEPQVLLREDEFPIASTEDGEIGDLGWRQLSAGAGTFSYTNAVAAHPGIIRMATAASANTMCGIGISATVGNNIMLAIEVRRMIWILRPVTTANMRVRVGIMQDPNTQATGGTDGVFFEYDSAVSANWRTITRAASSNTTNTSTVAITANNWYQLEMFRNPTTGNWDFTINGVLRFTHTATLPTVAVQTACLVETTEAVIKTIEIDYFGLRSQYMTQRWT